MVLKQFAAALKDYEDFSLRNTQCFKLQNLKTFLCYFAPNKILILMRWRNGRGNLPETIQKVTAPQRIKGHPL